MNRSIITFRGVRRTDSLEEVIETCAEKLERINPMIMSCRVGVERQQNHHTHGDPFRVRVDVRLPGKPEVFVEARSPRGPHHDHLPALIRKAFHTAERRIQESERV